MKYILWALLLYIIYRFIRNSFAFYNIGKQTHKKMQEERDEQPYFNRGTRNYEKDISADARIIEEKSGDEQDNH